MHVHAFTLQIRKHQNKQYTNEINNCLKSHVDFDKQNKDCLTPKAKKS